MNVHANDMEKRYLFFFVIIKLTLFTKKFLLICYSCDLAQLMLSFWCSLDPDNFMALCSVVIESWCIAWNRCGNLVSIVASSRVIHRMYNINPNRRIWCCSAAYMNWAVLGARWIIIKQMGPVFAREECYSKLGWARISYPPMQLLELLSILLSRRPNYLTMDSRLSPIQLWMSLQLMITIWNLNSWYLQFF